VASEHVVSQGGRESGACAAARLQRTPRTSAPGRRDLRPPGAEPQKSGWLGWPPCDGPCRSRSEC
jgi:hypothetical protein